MSIRQGLGLFVASVALILSARQITHAQTNTGEIAGVVRDSQDAAVAGVVITALHVESGTQVQRETDAGGRYFLPALRVGTHRISAEREGFRRILRSGVSFNSGRR